MTLFCHYCCSAVDEPHPSPTSFANPLEVKMTDDSTYACLRMECWRERNDATTTGDEHAALYLRWCVAKLDQEERMARIVAANAPRDLDEVRERLLDWRIQLQTERANVLEAFSDAPQETPACQQPAYHEHTTRPHIHIIDRSPHDKKYKGKLPVKARARDSRKHHERSTAHAPVHDEREILLAQLEQLKRELAAANSDLRAYVRAHNPNDDTLARAAELSSFEQHQQHQQHQHEHVVVTSPSRNDDCSCCSVSRLRAPRLMTVQVHDEELDDDYDEYWARRRSARSAHFGRCHCRA